MEWGGDSADLQETWIECSVHDSEGLHKREIY